MKTFVFSAIVFSVLFTYGVKGQCYNCTLTTMSGMTFGQPGCGDPFDSSGLQIIPCAGQCKTIKTETMGDGNTPPMTIVVRACHNEAFPCLGARNTKIENGTLTQTCCSGELCNGGDLNGGGDAGAGGEAGGADGETGGEGRDGGEVANAQATTPSSNAISSLINFSITLVVFAPLCALAF